MKKILVYVLIALLVVAVGLALYFGIKSKKNDNETRLAGVEVQYLDSTYNENGKMIYKVTIQRDETIESVKYSIDNAEEIEIDGQIGEAKNNKSFDAKNGKYFFESETDMISLTDLSEGTHLLNIYAYNDASERVECYTTTFKIVSAK